VTSGSVWGTCSQVSINHAVLETLPEVAHVVLDGADLVGQFHR